MSGRIWLSGARGFARRLSLLAAAGAVVALAVPAGAGAAAARPSGGAAEMTHELFHVCHVIGSPSGGDEAVHCADLFEQVGDVSPEVFFAENEVYCQTDASTPQPAACKAISESVQTASQDPGVGPTMASPVSGGCGISGHSACGSGRLITTAPTATVAAPGTGSCQAWGTTGDTAFGGVADKVTLSDGAVETGPDLSTSHETGTCK